MYAIRSYYVKAAIDRHADCSEHHRIKIETPTDLVLYGNHKELAQVFRQLVANACRFSPQGGEILLNAHAAEGAVERNNFV